jgi:hypothetical protein
VNRPTIDPGTHIEMLDGQRRRGRLEVRDYSDDPDDAAARREESAIYPIAMPTPPSEFNP